MGKAKKKTEVVPLAPVPSPSAKAPTKPRAKREKTEPQSLGLAPAEVADAGGKEVHALSQRIVADGGAVLASYREPWGGHRTVLAALPIQLVQPTPYQRDASAAHVKRLGEAIARSGRYLDPLIVVRENDGRYHTPNGNHRLQAMLLLGAKTIMALIVDDPSVAFHILALNTEKAHALKEKALEVARMYRALAPGTTRAESDFALELEEAPLATLGFAYEADPRFSGGAYQSLLRRADGFLDQPLAVALGVRTARAARLLEVDARVQELVQGLKDRGHPTASLKYFVVGRMNPFRSDRGLALAVEQTFDRMLELAAELDLDAIDPKELAGAGYGSEAE